MEPSAPLRERLREQLRRTALVVLVLGVLPFLLAAGPTWQLLGVPSLSEWSPAAPS